jgi:hypothetical protein
MRLRVERGDVRQRASYTVTGRHPGFYELYFGLKPEDFARQTILDAGAGRTRLQDHLRERGVNAQVVALDLGYGGEAVEGRGGARRVNCIPTRQVPRPAVGGDMRRLPFGNETFARVMASWALSSLPPDEQPGAARELVRVVQQGGTLHLYPFFRPRRQKHKPPPETTQVRTVTFTPRTVLALLLAQPRTPGRVWRTWGDLYPEVQARVQAIRKGRRVVGVSIRKTEDEETVNTLLDLTFAR